MRLAVALFLVLSSLSGCLYVGARSSIGQTFSEDALESVQPGLTTRSEMLALLGPPHEFLEPETSAALLDDSLRLDGVLDVARRSEHVWTWQAERVEANGTWLLLYGGVWVTTDVELLVVVFDEHGVVQHMARTVQEQDS